MKTIAAKLERGLAFALMIILVTALIGCNNEIKDTGLVKDYAQEKRVSVTFFCDKKITSNIWATSIISDDGTKIQMIDEAEDYYNSKGEEDYRTFLKNRLLETDSVDLYIINAEDVIDFNNRGLWYDLSSLEAVKNLSEDALLQSSYQEKVFSIPLTYTGFGFYWNVGILERYGLKVPANLEEFLNVCQILKDKEITPYLGNMGYALTVPAMAVGFSDLYASEDCKEKIAALASGKTPVSSYMKKGFEFIEFLKDRGYLDAGLSLETVPAEGDKEAFLAGQGAFFCGQLGLDMSEADFPVMMTGIPVLEDGQVSIVGANYRVALNPSSTHLEYAIEVMEYLFSPEQSVKFAREYNQLSAFKNSETDYLGDASQSFAALVQSGGQIPNQDFRLTFNTWSNIRDLCRKVLQGTTAEQAALQYDEIQQQEIGAANQ